VFETSASTNSAIRAFQFGLQLPQRYRIETDFTTKRFEKNQSFGGITAKFLNTKEFSLKYSYSYRNDSIGSSLEALYAG